MSAEYVDARWVAPFVGELPGRKLLVPGETVVKLPRAEAENSEHWRVVETAAPTQRKPAKQEADD